MVRLLALVVALAGCAPGEPVPGFRAELRCEAADCSEWTPVAVAAVLEDFRARWGALFDEVPAVPALVVVEDAAWWPGVEGYSWGEEVRILPVAPTGWQFVHELVHNALRAATGDGDHDHVDGDGPWTERHDFLIETAAAPPQIPAPR